MTDLAKRRLDDIQIAIHDATRDLPLNEYVDVMEALEAFLRPLFEEAAKTDVHGD